MATHDLVHLFVDTNLFIEFQDIQTLDFCKLLDASSVVLVIAAGVNKELLNHKRSPKRRVRDRGVRAIALLDRAAEDLDINLKEGVTLQFYDSRFSDYERYDLDSTDPDSGILLSAIHYKIEHPELLVGFVSEDRAARNTARRNGLVVKAPPEEWELPPVDDPLELEVKELRKQISARPRLDVTLDGKLVESSVKLPAPVPSTSRNEIAMFVDRERNARWPAVPQQAYAFGHIHPSVFHLQQDVSRYCNQLTKYLSKYIEWKQYMSRVVPVKLTLHNTGGQPARNIRVKVCVVGRGFKLVGTIPEEPQKPREPSGDPYSHMLGPSFPTIVSPLWSPTISDSSAQFCLPRLQHLETEELETVFVVFDDYQATMPLVLQVETVCDEIPVWNKRTLKIGVETAQGTGSPVLHEMLRG